MGWWDWWLCGYSASGGSLRGKSCTLPRRGNDANNSGLSWATAKVTVQAGLNAAVSGDEVWVAAGAYVERVTLKAGVALYGGFNGDETDRTQRNWTANRAILDGNAAGTVATAPTGATSSTRIDGFTIRNGKASSGGVKCSSSSPTIANNLITGNAGVGVSCASASPVVTGNTIVGNTGSGVDCYASQAIIGNNAITGNGNSGVYCYSSSPTIANNLIAGNAASLGGGIYCLLSSANIINNTVVGNSAGSDGGGIYSSSGTPLIANTIIAFNSSGVCTAYGQPSLRYSCAYGNRDYDYSGMADPAGANGNISANPRLAGVQYGNAHIQPSSPCVDAGDNSVTQSGWKDIDREERISGSRVDIGADESFGGLWAEGPYITVRVSLQGNDNNDGSSWMLTKRTVQAAIDLASSSGGEVWVKAGTYPERLVLRPYVHIYGGFDGTESSRRHRSWSVNTTILESASAGPVVTASQFGYGSSTIDGFTIRVGRSRSGDGVYCSYASPCVSNNTITRDSAASYGRGVDCYYASPTVTKNTINGNRAGDATGAGCLL